MIALKSWRRYFLPIIILWLAFGLRLYRLDFQSIWWDEGHSIAVAEQPLTRIPTLPAMDVHPPAYFALLHGWLAVAGLSEFALRYLSAGFGLLTVALVWRFAAVLARAPALAALLAALSPVYVAYSQEVRSYTQLTFLALAAIFFLWRIILAGDSCQPADIKKDLVGYVVFSTACLYTHYFTIFLLLFQNLAWLAAVVCLCPALSTPKKLAGWFGSQLATLLLFAPQLALAARQVAAYANPNLRPPTLTEFISRSWQAYTVGLALNPNLAGWGMLAIAGALLVSWAMILARRPALVVWRNFLFLLAWLLIPLLAYFAVLQVRPSFEPRYLMPVTPAIFLLLTLGFSRVRRGVGVALAVVTLLALLVGLHGYYTDATYFKDDSAGVARWLAANTTAKDIVLVDVPHPFDYYAGRSQILAPVDYLFVDIHTAAATLNRVAARRNRLFWVTWAGSDTDPRGVINFLAEKAGRLAGQMDFKGYHLIWFDLPPGTNFSLPTQLSPQIAVFGDTLALDGAAVSTGVTPGRAAWATLHFSLRRETAVNYKVSLRLRNPAGAVVSQVDRDLLNDRHFRTSAWPLDDPALNQAINVYLLPLSPDTPPGAYRLEAVVYNAEPPYPAEGVTGAQTPDGVAAILGAVIVAPAP